MERIVVGIDGSRTARRALHWAIEEARLRSAGVEAFHVWHNPCVGAFPYPPPAYDRIDMERCAKGVLDEAVDAEDARGLPAQVQKVLVEGDAAKTLIDAAKGADLVVLGSRGRGGFAGLLLGSVSQQVVHHAPCPAVVVPPAAD